MTSDEGSPRAREGDHGEQDSGRDERSPRAREGDHGEQDSGRDERLREEPRAGGNELVSVIMGSDSDYDVMGGAAEVLADFGVAHEVRVVSAHRTPLDMASYAQAAADRGLKVIIAGAGGAAHLPGMVASLTTLPVIGVPVALKHLDGMDSLLSIVQMPAGVPVATVSIGGARNAGLLAVRVLAVSDPALRERMAAFQAGLADAARAKDAALGERLRRG